MATAVISGLAGVGLDADTAWDVLEGFASTRFDNHLHRQCCAQALRIHEANHKANLANHRAEVGLANVLHDREIKQGHLMHEEEVDLEKRGALRENIRDVWLQLCDQAETVFVVNTLVLGVAFAMLAEASLPDSITLDLHPIMVLYFCTLSASISLLLASVRYAMILRMSVGERVTQLLRDSIRDTQKEDDKFREAQDYADWYREDREKFVEAACVPPMPYRRKRTLGGRRLEAGNSGLSANGVDEGAPGSSLKPLDLQQLVPRSDLPAEWRPFEAGITGGCEFELSLGREWLKCAPLVLGLPNRIRHGSSTAEGKAKAQHYGSSSPCYRHGSLETPTSSSLPLRQITPSSSEKGSIAETRIHAQHHGSSSPNGHRNGSLDLLSPRRASSPRSSADAKVKDSVLYYEVTITHFDGRVRFGFASSDFLTDREYDIGDGANSWGAVCMERWSCGIGFVTHTIRHNGFTHSRVTRGIGGIFGVAANINRGKIAVKNDGVWEVVLANDRIKEGVYPVLSAQMPSRVTRESSGGEHLRLTMKFPSDEASLSSDDFWKNSPVLHYTDPVAMFDPDLAGPEARDIRNHFSDLGWVNTTGMTMTEVFHEFLDQLLPDGVQKTSCKRRLDQLGDDDVGVGAFPMRSNSRSWPQSIPIGARSEEEDGVDLRLTREKPGSSFASIASHDSVSMEIKRCFDKIREHQMRLYDNDQEVQNHYYELRDRYYIPWSDCAQRFFSWGSRCLLAAACCLVIGRFYSEKSPIPEGALAYPASPVAVLGFCVPVLISLGILIGLERLDRIGDRIYAEVHLMKLFKKRWVNENERHGISVDKLRKELADILAAERKISKLSDQFLEYLIVTRNNERVDRRFTDESFNRIQKKPLSPTSVADIIFGVVGFSSVFFFILALVIGPSSMLTSRLGTTESRIPSEGGESLQLSELRLSEDSEWPSFWEPSGATFWASQSSLLIVGGSTLLKLDVGNLRNGRISSIRQLASSFVLSDACATSGSRGDELWLADTSDTFRLRVALVDDILKQSLPEPSVFAESIESSSAQHRHPGKLVLDCRGGSGANSLGYLWFAENRELHWPVLRGASVSASLVNDTWSGCADVGGFCPMKKVFGLSEQWPASWLLTNSNITAMLRRACPLANADHSRRRFPADMLIEGVAMVGTNVLLLLTPSCPDALTANLESEAPHQLLVSINSFGQISWWRKVATVAELLFDTTRTHRMHLQGWRAIAVDIAYRNIFLVSGGPTPHIAYVQLPFL